MDFDTSRVLTDSFKVMFWFCCSSGTFGVADSVPGLVWGTSGVVQARDEVFAGEFLGKIESMLIIEDSFSTIP